MSTALAHRLRYASSTLAIYPRPFRTSSYSGRPNTRRALFPHDIGKLSRQLNTSSSHRASGSILNLSGLSASRESRFLSKERGIPRTEFSPHLELIRTSEVDPFDRKKKNQNASNAERSGKYSKSRKSFAFSPATDASATINLAQECAVLRLEKQSLTDALEKLQQASKSKDKEVFQMMFIIAILLLVVFFPGETSKYGDPLYQQFREYVAQFFRENGTVPSAEASLNATRTLSIRESTQDAKSSTEKEKSNSPVEVSMSPSSTQRPKGVWSNIFWASST